ncbi:MAG: hypothetical protein ACK413_03405 [Patescibacteria group bacterium]
MTKIFIAIKSSLKNFFTFKRILNLLLVLWVLFSLGYIGWDIFNKFKFRVFQAGYQQALTDSVKSIIQQAEKCQTVSVFEGGKRVDLISINCLQKQEK